MNSLICDRFVSTLRADAEKLKNLGQGGLNPTVTKTFGDLGHVFSDRCEYTYSLYSLDMVFASINRLATLLAYGRDVVRRSFEYGMASLIAFNLRGYVGALSEETWVLNQEKLSSLPYNLFMWRNAGYESGIEQDQIYQLLWDYAVTKVSDIDVNNGKRLSQDEKDRYIDLRVQREMKAFVELSRISANIMIFMLDGIYVFDSVSSVPLLKSGT